MKANINGIDCNNNKLVIETLKSLREELPIQAPMTFFVHNNPLMYYEKYPYEEGMEKAFLTYVNAVENNSRHIWRELEDFLLPILNSYFDQGVNNWVGPQTKTGLLDWFKNYVDYSLSYKANILKPLKKEIPEYLEQYNADRELAISNLVLNRLKKEEHQNNLPLYESIQLYLQTLLFHFKGWSGMVSFLEKNPDKFPIKNIPICFYDWVMMLTLTEQALFDVKRKPRAIWDLKRLSEERQHIRKKIITLKNVEQEFYAKMIHLVSKQLWTDQKNRKIEILKGEAEDSVLFLCCIDDREESFRRHLESMSNNYKTYGTVGFFGLDFSLKKLTEIIYKPQCPPVITPKKRAVEVEGAPSCHHHDEISNNLIKKFIFMINYGNASFISTIVSTISFPFVLIFLLLRTCFPKSYTSIKERIVPDSLNYKNYVVNFEDDYSDDEKASIVFTIIKSAGIVQVQSKIVYIVAHGSTSKNNPYLQAYGCGACSGENGLTNARIFCEWANSTFVRDELELRGISISKETIFIPLCHDTSLDQIIEGHKLNAIPLELSPNQIELHYKVIQDLQKVLILNQNERWKQFSLNVKKDTPLERSLHWGEPRPEFGHNQVSMAIFAPREITKNIDLKRCSFLISYDPEFDLSGEDLAFNILNALPVCANINLDYLTSSAYSEAFGPGSKLPLNLASGIGMISGSKSDLKIGLATQMTDTHNPVRLLVFIYCQKEKLDEVIRRSPRLQNIIENNWIHILLISPEDQGITNYTKEISTILSRSLFDYVEEAKQL